MKICYVATTVHISKDLKEAIGATTHTFALASELSKLGHEIHIVSEKFRGDLDFEKINSLYIHRFFRGIIKSSKEIKKSKIKKIARYLKIFPNLILAFKIAKIVQKYNCDLILERAHSLGVGAWVSILTGKPFVLEVIDCIFSKLAVERAKSVIAYTKIFFSPKIQKKVHLISAGFDPKIFYPQDLDIKYDICYVGAFKEWDGLEDLIKAVDLIKEKKQDVEVILVGDGVRFDQIKRLIKKYGLEKNFILTGRIALSDVSKFIAQSKICVAPYNVKRSAKGEFQKYGFYFSPLKIFEYLACGKPVVATDYPMIKKIITQENGELTQEGNAKDLAEKILFLLEKKDLAMIRDKNLALAKKYTWENVAKKIDKILKACIK